MGSAAAYRGVATLSAILGLAVIVVSCILLIQSLGYRNELGYIFGYQLPNIGAGNYNNYNANRYTYNILGYELDPLIGISSGGIIIGLLQLISSFILCTGRRTLSIGWAVGQFLLFIGAITCFALAIYFQAYSYKYIPGYGILGGNGGGGLFGNYGGYNNYANPGLGGVGYGAAGIYNRGLYGGYDGDYLCNPSGQAYCALLGIDMFFLLIAVFVVACAARNSHDEYSDASVHRRYNDNVKHVKHVGP